jgi:hypothetical protein
LEVLQEPDWLQLELEQQLQFLVELLLLELPELD